MFNKMNQKSSEYPSYWALLPILFCGIHFVELYQRGEGIHILWLCHLSNLLLAVGLFLRRGQLVGAAVVWMIIGLPLWIFDIFQSGEFLPTSLFTHFGGLILGILALRELRYPQNTWLYGILWGILAQQITRLVTPYKDNINLAHRIWDGLETTFGSYLEYWTFCTVSAIIFLFIFEMIFRKIYSKEKLAQKTDPVNQKKDIL